MVKVKKLNNTIYSDETGQIYYSPPPGTPLSFGGNRIADTDRGIMIILSPEQAERALRGEICRANLR